MRHRSSTLKLGDDRVAIYCVQGPLDQQHVEVPPRTKEFFALDHAPIALTADALLRRWRYTPTLITMNDDVVLHQVWRGELVEDTLAPLK